MLDLKRFDKKTLTIIKWITLVVMAGLGQFVGGAFGDTLLITILIGLFTSPKFNLKYLLPWGLGLAFLASGLPTLVMLAGIIGVIAGQQILFKKRRSGQAKLSGTAVKRLEKADFSALTKRDVAVFNEVYSETDAQLTDIKRWLGKTKGLIKLNEETQLMYYADAVMQEMAKEPADLMRANDFVYKTVPTLHELLASYLEIAQHEIISDAQKEELRNARAVIRDLAVKVQAAYLAVTEDDVASLRDKVSVAKRTMEDTL